MPRLGGLAAHLERGDITALRLEPSLLRATSLASRLELGPRPVALLRQMPDSIVFVGQLVLQGGDFVPELQKPQFEAASLLVPDNEICLVNHDAVLNVEFVDTCRTLGSRCLSAYFIWRLQGIRLREPGTYFLAYRLRDHRGGAAERN